MKNVYFADARDYGKVVEAETKFFKGLAGVRAEFSGNKSIDESCRKMATFANDPKGNTIEFTVEFDVDDPHKGTAYKLFLGTRLSPATTKSMAEVTHYLCLADEKSLLAKFHADYDFELGSKEKKPSPHAQIGGRIPASLKSRYNQQYWHLDVNKPRIPALPICTALLWHWAFLEYEDNVSFSKVLRNTWWTKLVTDAESAVLKPFFKDGARLMDQHGGNGLLNSLYVPLAR